MSNYRFIEQDKVSKEDVKKLTKLTEDGILEWHLSNGYCALSAYPYSQVLKDDEKASSEVIGENLRGSRIGFRPDNKDWHYLRLTDHNRKDHYVEKDSEKSLTELVDKLYETVVKQAANMDIFAKLELKPKEVIKDDVDWLFGTGRYAQ